MDLTFKITRDIDATLTYQTLMRTYEMTNAEVNSDNDLIVEFVVTHVVNDDGSVIEGRRFRAELGPQLEVFHAFKDQEFTQNCNMSRNDMKLTLINYDIRDISLVDARTNQSVKATDEELANIKAYISRNILDFIENTSHLFKLSIRVK